MQRTSDGIVTKRLMSPGSGCGPPEHGMMIHSMIIGSIVRVAYKPLDGFNAAALPIVQIEEPNEIQTKVLTALGYTIKDGSVLQLQN